MNDINNIETKQDKFNRLINPRFTKAIKAIRLLKNLSSKASYSYTEKQIVQILQGLQKEVDDIAEAFSDDGVADGPELISTDPE